MHTHTGAECITEAVAIVVAEADMLHHWMAESAYLLLQV